MILEIKEVIVRTFKHPEEVTQAWPVESRRKATDVAEQPSMAPRGESTSQGQLLGCRGSRSGSN